MQDKDENINHTLCWFLNLLVVVLGLVAVLVFFLSPIFLASFICYCIMQGEYTIREIIITVLSITLMALDFYLFEWLDRLNTQLSKN